MASVNSVPGRAKDQLHTVLLTLLSIVQALALELLWSHITSNDYLYDWSWLTFMCWAQIGATLLGVLLIWLIYTSMTMRFRWVPTVGDTVFPFFIGIIEFTLIAGLGPDNMGWWFLDMALIFAVMSGVAQVTLRRARLDGENDAYFATVSPATARDFYPVVATVLALACIGVFLLVSGEQGWIALAGVVGTTAALGHQMYMNTVFWNRSIMA